MDTYLAHSTECVGYEMTCLEYLTTVTSRKYLRYFCLGLWKHDIWPTLLQTKGNHVGKEKINSHANILDFLSLFDTLQACVCFSLAYVVYVEFVLAVLSIWTETKFFLMFTRNWTWMNIVSFKRGWRWKGRYCNGMSVWKHQKCKALQNNLY